MSKKKSKSASTGAERKATILEAGAKLASKYGAVNVTRRMVAEAAGCSEALVSVYMGDSATAQKAYRRKMKAMKLSEPSKADIEAIGVKLRAHGPRDKRDTRKRSAKEVKAIKEKRAAAKKPAKKRVTKKPTPTETKPTHPNRRLRPAPDVAPLPLPTETKVTAARQPKAPPPSMG